MNAASLDLDVFKDIPGYKGILKAVLKYQIQLLVEQLSEHGGEESVLLLANISEGTLSHLGTKAGKGFLIDNSDVKRQYLSYCLKRHQNDKRKAEFMPLGGSEEGVQPSKVTHAAPESVVSFPVHKKPYFRMQRRNTRIRSGSKQFSSAFTKVGMNRSIGQRFGGKVVPAAGYVISSRSGSAYQGQVLDNGGQRADEAHSLPYEGQRSGDQDQGQSPQVVVKTERQTDDNAGSEENTNTVNEKDVTVKVEPPDVIDETGDRESRAITEDVQTFGDGLGPQYSPMESEESFSEGNQSFEYVLDQDNSTEIITPWKPEENDRISQVTSKRKQTLPTRITKTGEVIKIASVSSIASDGTRTGCRDTNSPGIFSQTSQYGGVSGNQKSGNSGWFTTSEVKGNMNQKIGTAGFIHVPAYRDKNQGSILNQQTFGNAPDLKTQRNVTVGGKNTGENMYDRMQGSVWTQEQLLNLSAETMPKSGPYSEIMDDKSGQPKGLETSWQEESYPPGGMMKTYMKTPQIDGLFVSRGEGRYEKLIKCEECGKVCRTSNMARHKKRYCTALPKEARTRKNFCQANEYISVKDMPLEGPGGSIYVDNPEKQGYNMDLTDSAKDINADIAKIQRQPSVMDHVHLENSSAVSNPGVFMNAYLGPSGSVFPGQNQDGLPSTSKTNIIHDHSPPSAKVLQENFKKQKKSAPSLQLINTSQKESDIVISNSDFEHNRVNSGLMPSSLAVSKSNETLKKVQKVFDSKTNEYRISDVDMDISESQLSDTSVLGNMAADSRGQLGTEEMPTKEGTNLEITKEDVRRGKENDSEDNFQPNVLVKQEPDHFDNM